MGVDVFIVPVLPPLGRLRPHERPEIALPAADSLGPRYAAFARGLEDYQRARVRTFLAWDEAAHGRFDLYQPLNARIAVGAQ